MKKFKFNLQRILSLKERKEELLKQELNRLYFKKNQHEHIKSHYENLVKSEYEKTREKKVFLSEDYQQQERFTFSLRNQIFNQDLMLKEYDIKIEKKMREILENRKEIKTMDRLKENKLEEYNYELFLDERKQMDEISNRQVNRGL